MINIEILRILGKFTNELRTKTKSFIKPNQNISDIIDFVENNILKKGYKPAFPCTVCINEITAHYTYFEKENERITKKGDIIKVDFGIVHKNQITDCAFTIELETNIHQTLLKANQETLNNILTKIQIGTTLSEIGTTSFKTAKLHNFNTIHNLSGHQIEDNNLHAGLSIPNYDNKSSKQIPNNSILAIEPFLTSGNPKVISKGTSNILKLESTKPVRNYTAKKILEHIKTTYPHLPFAKRWLLNHFPKNKLLSGLRFLKLNGNIHEYDCLVSSSNDIVSQFEDTIVFHNNKKEIITRL